MSVPAASAAAAIISSLQDPIGNTPAAASTTSNIPNYEMMSTTTQPKNNFYESIKRSDWDKFTQYLHDHQQPLLPNNCRGPDIIKFLGYLDQFGELKVHSENCPFIGHSRTSSECSCPVRQYWKNIQAVVERLRVVFTEMNYVESSPFEDQAVETYLLEMRGKEEEIRGVTYETGHPRNERSVTIRDPPPIASFSDGRGSSLSRRQTQRGGWKFKLFFCS